MVCAQNMHHVEVIKIKFHPEQLRLEVNVCKQLIFILEIISLFTCIRKSRSKNYILLKFKVCLF